MVKGVAQRGVVVETVVGDRAQPAHALFVAAVFDVVVLEAAALVDLHFATQRVEHRAAPIGAVDRFVLILHGQGVGQLVVDVGEQGERHGPGIALFAIDIAIAFAVAEIQAGVVADAVAVVERMVEAERGLAAVIGAVLDSPLVEVLVAAGQLGDVVDRSTHGTGTEEEARRPADGFDPVIDPAVHRARGDGVVLHADAVEQLGDLCPGKAPISH
ncbi:hypothetical protein D3C81_1423350 [compost metagenome]